MEDGASSSPHPHHPPVDAGNDEASGTSFDELLATTIAYATNLEAPPPVAADTTATLTAGVAENTALTADFTATPLSLRPLLSTQPRFNHWCYYSLYRLHRSI